MAYKLMATVLASLLTASVHQVSHRKCTIRVTFDYDFSATPACSAKVTRKKCVQQFNLYEISLGIQNRAKLLSIPVPAGATGEVKGISGTTEPLLFDRGRHMIAVSAQAPNGEESDLTKCSTIIKVR